MKYPFVFLVLALGLSGLVLASPATSKADLKTAQMAPIPGLDICAASASTCDTYTFTGVGSPSFLRLNLSYDEGVGTSGHPLRCTSTSIIYAYNNGGGETGGIAYVSGESSTLLSEVHNNAGNYIFTSTPVSTVVFNSNGYGDYEDTLSLTTPQTSALSVYIGQNGPIYSIGIGDGTNVTVTANSVTSFSLKGELNAANTNGLYVTLNLAAATSVDFSNISYSYPGSTTMSLTVTCNATTLTLPSSLDSQYGNDTWTGPFTAATVDALFEAYDGGYTEGQVITVAGSSAPPTSASLAARNDLIASGCSITTN